MTRTINLLSPEALERLMAGPEGTDVAGEMEPEPLPGVAGWEGAPLSATVDCGTCQHRVAFGECCPRCDANCSLPASPANEEK